MNETARIARRIPWLAGVMSLSPGLGQLYNGQVTKAILFYVGSWGLAIVFLAMLLYSPFAPPLNVVIPTLILAVAYIAFVADAVIIARRQGDQYELKPFNRWYVYLGFIVLGGLANEFIANDFRQSSVQAFKIPAKSMMPTLLLGDHILVDKQIYRGGKNPERGDVIVFKYPEDEKKDFIKRVVGLPSDTIEVRNKEIIVNGVSQNDKAYTQRVDQEGMLDRSVSPRDNFGPITVLQGSYFVLGDNRDQSLDSRFWGFVKREKIAGKGKIIYWSWDDKEFNVRWDRIGKPIQ